MIGTPRIRIGAAVVVALALGLAACGGSSSGGHTSTTTPASTTPTTPATSTKPAASVIHVTLTAPTHTPIVNKPWHYVVRVTDSGGQPVNAMVHLQALNHGLVVGQIGLHKAPTGVWAETITWPQASVGFPLVFQAVVTALGATKSVDYPLQVAPA